MSGRFVRKSHFRHVFGKTPKREETYYDIKLSTNGDGYHLAASEKYIIYATRGGGGPCSVFPMGKVGRVGMNAKTLNVHTSKTSDFAFNRFSPNLVATGAEDCTVGISLLPEKPEDFNGTPISTCNLEGHQKKVDRFSPNLVATGAEDCTVGISLLPEKPEDFNGTPISTCNLEGHQKKVDFVNWHPCADQILASAGHDPMCITWDTDEQKMINQFELSGNPTCLEWNTRGDLLCLATSDKKSIIQDPRTPKAAFNFKTGFQNARNIFHDNLGYFGVGGSKMGCHEYHIYDLKKASEPVTEFEVDDSAGMLLTHYDPDTKMLYIGSKGGSQVKYFELGRNGKMHKLSLYSMKKGIKGFFFLP
eukprot:CAMPEP_0114488684 /NCGR_PEP_ID=MMETSP0109-20121206/1465_1 /TAXON_ID=29199 /ORGANISM="Chlorarachnion reptans, Strain CCCM449" /LENGTH=361 /DNA_ID=CAMNT_0001665101 /DNA_START=81 /DNA_END=1162 /DNA_ORIENTATION=+